MNADSVLSGFVDGKLNAVMDEAETDGPARLCAAAGVQASDLLRQRAAPSDQVREPAREPEADHGMPSRAGAEPR